MDYRLTRQGFNYCLQIKVKEYIGTEKGRRMFTIDHTNNEHILNLKTCHTRPISGSVEKYDHPTGTLVLLYVLLIDRPNVAGAVLQTLLSLFN